MNSRKTILNKTVQGKGNSFFTAKGGSDDCITPCFSAGFKNNIKPGFSPKKEVAEPTGWRELLSDCIFIDKIFGLSEEDYEKIKGE